MVCRQKILNKFQRSFVKNLKLRLNNNKARVTKGCSSGQSGRKARCRQKILNKFQRSFVKNLKLRLNNNKARVTKGCSSGQSGRKKQPLRLQPEEDLMASRTPRPGCGFGLVCRQKILNKFQRSFVKNLKHSARVTKGCSSGQSGLHGVIRRTSPIL